MAHHNRPADIVSACRKQHKPAIWQRVDGFLDRVRVVVLAIVTSTEIFDVDRHNGKQGQEMEQVERLKAHNAAVREHITSVVFIKEALINEDYSSAYEAIHELKECDDNASWNALWVAPSKGGIWTTREREQMKSNEMNEAKNGFHNGEAA